MGTISIDLHSRNRHLAVADFSQASPKCQGIVQQLLTVSGDYPVVRVAVWELDHLCRLLDSAQIDDEGYITEECRAAWESHRKLVVDSQQHKASVDADVISAIRGSKATLYKDQQQCVTFHTHMQRSIEGSETGVGKSNTLLHTYLYWRSVSGGRAIIICANSGKLDWEEQIGRFTELKCLVVGNGTAGVLKSIDQFAQDPSIDVLVVHYEAVISKAILKALLGLQFAFIGVDEAHYIKNPSTVRHKAVMNIISNNRKAKIVLATGTAIDGSPRSAWALLRIVYPGYIPSYYQFCQYFTIREKRYFGRRTVWVETGVRNLQLLRELLSHVMIRYVKAEVLDRPSKIFKTRIVQMTAVQRKLYTDILNGVISEIRKTVDGAVMVSELASKVLRLRQVLNHPALVGGDDTAESCKYNELDLILEELLSQDGMRVLIWTQWRDSVSKLCARYKEYGALPLIGGSNDKQVRDALRSGQCRVVVAIPEKAGTSIDWLQLCRAAVYLEKPWSLVLYRQSLDRIDRRSNTDPALIMFIECQRSVDQLVNAVLTKRQGVMDALSLDEDKLISLGKEEVLQLLRQ